MRLSGIVRQTVYLAIAVLLVLSLVFLWRARQPEYRIDTSRDAVVKQIQELSRLETASFTIEKIVEAGTSGNAINEFLFGDRLLLIAHGEIIAGFDLSNIEEENVSIDDSTITLELPPPQILVSRLDSNKTRVYDRDQGLLAVADKDLESEARQEAEESIRQAACEGGILQEASDNARNQLEALLKAFGFATAVIEIPNGEC